MSRCIGCDALAFGEIDIHFHLTSPVGDVDTQVTIGLCQSCCNRLKNGERLDGYVEDEDHP